MPSQHMTEVKAAIKLLTKRSDQHNTDQGLYCLKPPTNADTKTE